MRTKEKMLTVFSPEGVAEQHTVPNARDLVNGSNYTWDAMKTTNPVSHTPVLPKRTKRKIAEEIFENATGDSGDSESAGETASDEAGE